MPCTPAHTHAIAELSLPVVAERRSLFVDGERRHGKYSCTFVRAQPVLTSRADHGVETLKARELLPQAPVDGSRRQVAREDYKSKAAKAKGSYSNYWLRIGRWSETQIMTVSLPASATSPQRSAAQRAPLLLRELGPWQKTCPRGMTSSSLPMPACPLTVLLVLQGLRQRSRALITVTSQSLRWSFALWVWLSSESAATLSQSQAEDSCVKTISVRAC